MCHVSGHGLSHDMDGEVNKNESPTSISSISRGIYNDDDDDYYYYYYDNDKIDPSIEKESGVIIDPSIIKNEKESASQSVAFNLTFVCQVSVTGYFVTQQQGIDGILGMENEKTSFWKQMYAAKRIPRPEFSLCFPSSRTAKGATGNIKEEEEEEGAEMMGAMTLGGVDTRLHNSPMVFAKNVRSSGFYGVYIKSIYLREGGGISAQTTLGDMGNMHKLSIDEEMLNQGGAIIDSASTDTYFPRALADSFKEVWKKLTGWDYTHAPISLTVAENSKLPTIVLILQGDYLDNHNGQQQQPVTGDDESPSNLNDIPGYVGNVTDLSTQPKDVIIAISASNYMELVDPNTNMYVARFYTEEAMGSVFGANAMMGHDVFFDNWNGRIGFAESNCDFSTLLGYNTAGNTVGHPYPDNVDVNTNGKPEVTEVKEGEGANNAVADGNGGFDPSNYSIKFQQCINDQVVLGLCPGSDSCGGVGLSCSSYVMDMFEYLDTTLKYLLRLQEKFCELCYACMEEEMLSNEEIAVKVSSRSSSSLLESCAMI